MAMWSSYISITLFRVMPAGSGVIVVNVAVLGILPVLNPSHLKSK